MSEKSIRKGRGHEMSGKAKLIRKALMDLTPPVNMSKNDLFNQGYGGFISAVIAIGFAVTFAYYSVANTLQNKSAHFLVPETDEVRGVYCKHVPVPISAVYYIDSKGRWNSDTKYNRGDSIYGLEFVNAQYTDKGHYSAQMSTFVESLKDHANYDYAQTIVYGGSYSDPQKAQDGGVVTFSIDADSRIMYDVPIYTSGFSTSKGFCKSEYSTFDYDGINFNFQASIAYGEYFCPYLYQNYALETALGVEASASDVLGVYSTSIKIDAASITTAIAVNTQMVYLKSLQNVPSLDTVNLRAYIDPDYAPMQPVYCYDSAQHGHRYSTFCLIKLGSTFAYPITSHFGQAGDEFMSDACDCEKSDEQPDCQIYDITIGLLFIPYDFMSSYSSTRVKSKKSSGKVAPSLEELMSHDVKPQPKKSNVNKFSALNFSSTDDIFGNDDFFSFGSSFSYNFYFDDFISASYYFFTDDDEEVSTDDGKLYPYQDDVYHSEDIINMIFRAEYAVGVENITNLFRPTLLSSITAGYTVNVGEELQYTDALDSLSKYFYGFDDLVMFSFELYDYAHTLTGPTINDGGRVIANMSCSNVFFDESVLAAVQNTFPADIIEPYKVCWDSTGTAVSTAISNAYASASLYTSVLLFILLVIINRIHNRYFAKTPMYSTEEQEVIIRNSIADLFEFLIEKSDCIEMEEREFVADKLDKISITDPLTHAERPHNFGKFAALIAASRSGKSDPSANEPVVYQGTLVEEIEIPATEIGV